MKNAEFTEKEMAVLYSLHNSMNGNGYDFGFTDDIRPEGMTPRQAGAVLRVVRKKLAIYTNDPVTTDSGTFYQITATWKNEMPSGSDFDTWLAAIERVSK